MYKRDKPIEVHLFTVPRSSKKSISCSYLSAYTRNKQILMYYKPILFHETIVRECIGTLRRQMVMAEEEREEEREDDNAHLQHRTTDTAPRTRHVTF